MKKTKYYLISILFLLSLNIIPIHAYNGIPTTKIIQQEYVEVVPYADQGTWKFREVGNKLQKRLWNNTRGVWVGEWITVAVAIEK